MQIMESNLSSRNKGIESFWKNYQRVQEWRFGSNVLHLESKLKALEVENAFLHNFILTEFQLKTCGTRLNPVTSEGLNYVGDSITEVSSVRVGERADDDDEVSDPEISEELLAFYEQTVRHKIEHRKNVAEEKQRQAEKDSFMYDEVRSASPLRLAHRTEDMCLLFGDAAAKISSMELSMQINFDSNRLKTSASLWPNIPLRLS